MICQGDRKRTTGEVWRAQECKAERVTLTFATERELGLSQGKVAFLPFENPLRYEYAILQPDHRPASQLALNIKAGWKAEVLKKLEEVGANPRAEWVDETEGKQD